MSWTHHYMVKGNACRGCGSMLAGRLSMEAVFETRRDALVFGSSCGAGNSDIGAFGGGGLGFDGAALSGLQMALEIEGNPRPLVIIAGEGRTTEMSFEVLSACVARGQQIAHILVDNQAYAFSGTHGTTTTSMGARTAIQAWGKPTGSKNVGLMMIFNGAKYVATASPAFPDDLRQKVIKAIQHMPSYVQLYSPCITSWGLDTSDTIKLSRMAASNGMFPLWEYDRGVFKRTIKPRQRENVRGYLELQRRYRGVSEEEIANIDAEAAQMDGVLDRLEGVFAG